MNIIFFILRWSQQKLLLHKTPVSITDRTKDKNIGLKYN